MTGNTNNQEAQPTREQLKKEKSDQNNGTMREQRKRVRVRLIPIWLRVIIVTLLLAGSIILGALVGYSVMGDGKPGDIFKKSTWTHITDLIDHE